MCDVFYYFLDKTVSIFAPVVGLIIAWLGLKTWRKQLKGTTEYELAKRIMLATYRVQEGIQQVRSPLMQFSQDELENSSNAGSYQNAFENRLNKLANKLAELSALRLEVKVHYGDQQFKLFDDLYSAVGNLRGSIYIIVKSMHDHEGDKRPSFNQDLVDSADDIVYWTSDGDEFSLRVAAAVSKIEAFFKGKLTE